MDAAGNVSGSAEVHFPSDVVKMHIAVQCLVVERNTAWMSGTVTHYNDQTVPVGRVFVWQVQDNGEGQGAPPDRISNFVYWAQGNYAPDVCRWKPAMTTFPWDNGNVRILTRSRWATRPRTSSSRRRRSASAPRSSARSATRR